MILTETGPEPTSVAVEYLWKRDGVTIKWRRPPAERKTRVIHIQEVIIKTLPRPREERETEKEQQDVFLLLRDFRLMLLKNSLEAKPTKSSLVSAESPVS